MFKVDNPLYEFGPFTLDLKKRVLLRENKPVPLTPKVFETLVVLVQNKQQIVSKDDLMKSVWPNTFVEESNLSQNIFTLRKALGDSQHKRYIVTVPGRGYQFSEDVRQLGAANALEQTDELVIQSHSRSRVVIEQSPARFGLIWAAGALVLAVAGALLFYRNPGSLGSRSKDSAPATAIARPGIKVRRSVAVLGFRNLSGQPEQAWLSIALREMLDTELSAGNQLRTVPGEQIARSEKESNLPYTDSLGKDSLLRLRASLNTDYVVLGSFAVVGSKGKDQVRLDLKLQDATSGDTITETGFTGSTAEVFDLVSKAGDALREKLGITDIAAEQVAGIRASLPSNPLAAHLYADGLAKLRDYEVVAARDLLLRAARIEPSNALTHSALAAAWNALGYKEKAAQEAKLAFDLSAALSRVDRLSIEGRFRQLTNDYPAAIEIYRNLSETFPDDMEYGLLLATAQMDNQDSHNALQTIAKLRLIPSARADARIDLAEAKAQEKLGDFRKMQQAAASASANAKAQGSLLLTAQAKEQEGWALDHLGDLDMALSLLAEAMTAAEAAKNPSTIATVQFSTGMVYFDQGKYDLARRSLEDSERGFRKIGSIQNAGFAISGIAGILYMQGNLLEARRYYQETLRIDQELGEKGGPIGSDLGNLANVMIGLGDLVEATHLQEQSLATFREVGNRRGESATLVSLGSLLAIRGDLQGGKKTSEQAFAIAKQTGFERDRAYSMYNLAEIALAEDRLNDAQTLARQTLALRRQNGEQSMVAISQLQLAEIALQQGNPGEAETLARQAEAAFTEQQVTSSMSQSAAMLARALLAQGKSKDAKVAALRSVSLAKQVSDREPRFDATIAEAMVNNDPFKATSELEQIRAEAHRCGYFSYELDTRLHLATIELHSGNASGRQHLQQLQKDALAHGFALVARKAASAL
jgi:DNA-binding winged helix-turn-helix (wHTH) protein/tetratricopeptide (TPR) repeat protein